jgi:hypothetical protein
MLEGSSCTAVMWPPPAVAGAVGPPARPWLGLGRRYRRRVMPSAKRALSHGYVRSLIAARLVPIYAAEPWTGGET